MEDCGIDPNQMDISEQTSSFFLGPSSLQKPQVIRKVSLQYGQPKRD